MPISTFFVLNKKDRSGNVQSRPFHQVYEEIKRQDTEDAKLKQANNLKGGNILNLLPDIPKDNVFMQLFTSNNAKSVDSPIPPKTDTTEESTLPLVRQSVPNNVVINEVVLKPDEGVSEPHRPVKSHQRQSRSRTCQLL